jgi:hypothetical protein
MHFNFLNFQAFAAFIESGEKDPLMTYEKALITQSRGQEIPGLD